MAKSDSSELRRPLSAWQTQRVMAEARAALEQARSVDGLVIETGDDVLQVLNEESPDAITVLDRSVEAALWASGTADNAHELRKRYAGRAARFEAQYERWRKTIAAMMVVLFPPDNQGKRKAVRPGFTLSLGPGKRKVSAPDIDALEDKYVITKTETVITRDVNWELLEADLRAGEVIAGAFLVDGEPSLRINPR